MPRRASARRPHLGGVLGVPGAPPGGFTIAALMRPARPGRERDALARTRADRRRARAPRPPHALGRRDPGTADRRRSGRARPPRGGVAPRPRPRADASSAAAAGTRTRPSRPRSPSSGYADCTATAFRPAYLAGARGGSARGARLAALSARRGCSSCRRRTRSAWRHARPSAGARPAYVHVYFHDTDLLDARRAARRSRRALTVLGRAGATDAARRRRPRPKRLLARPRCRSNMRSTPWRRRKHLPPRPRAGHRSFRRDIRRSKPYLLARTPLSQPAVPGCQPLLLIALDLLAVGARPLRRARAPRGLLRPHPIFWGILWRDAEADWLPFVALVTVLVFWQAGLYAQRERRAGFGRIVSSLVVVALLVLAFGLGTGHDFSTFGLIPTTLVITAVLDRLSSGRATTCVTPGGAPRARRPPPRDRRRRGRAPRPPAAHARVRARRDRLRASSASSAAAPSVDLDLPLLGRLETPPRGARRAPDRRADRHRLRLQRARAAPAWSSTRTAAA